MNRSQRRAAFARGRASTRAAPADIAELTAEATAAYREGRSEQAEVVCRQILARTPANKVALNLLGVINQAAGRHRVAVKRLAEAIAADDRDAACHYNIAVSHQALGENGAAAAHYRRAIALGMSDDRDLEEFIMQNPDIVACVRRMAEQRALTGAARAMFGDRDLEALAKDILLQCALETAIIRGVALELLLTQLRLSLLQRASASILASAEADDATTGLFCALAQQCFINEYVYAQSDDEMREAGRLRDVLQEKVAAGSAISPLLLAAVASYMPLHSLPAAEALLAMPWPPAAAALVRQQIREPLEEKRDRETIAALTAVKDDTSLRVMQQYEENPYPRWAIDRLASLTSEAKRQIGMANGAAAAPVRDILIAGCGTGQQSIEMAQYFPDARILAVDISRPSLAYARRKTREMGLTNVDYAQADILQLAALGRSFDRIGVTGVLHHLADPQAGWRTLLSLLRPDGVMRVGLYSEVARQPIVEARALIAERGYRATAEGIRAFRQMVISERDHPRWRTLLTIEDFYSMSGCRDLLFHVMVHRFTIPQIKAFLDEQGLSFISFELDERLGEKFCRQFPHAGALTDLDCWHAFEIANPQTFRRMYLFSVRKTERTSR